jgi:hypothetical protein
MKTLLAATALILSMTATTNAADAPRKAGDVLAAGPIFSTNALGGLCWYTNFGTTSITPTSQIMYAWTSNVAVATSVSCATGSPVAPGQSCYIDASNSNNGFSCEVTFNTRLTNMRGSLALTDASNNELSQVELR